MAALIVAATSAAVTSAVTFTATAPPATPFPKSNSNAVGRLRPSSMTRFSVSTSADLATATMLPTAGASWMAEQVGSQPPQASVLLSSHASGPFKIPSPQYGPVRLSWAEQVALQCMQV